MQRKAVLQKIGRGSAGRVNPEERRGGESWTIPVLVLLSVSVGVLGSFNALCSAA
jgi:hypothetical protein